MRRARGPLLFYVTSGTVSISVNGSMKPHESGDSVLVETDQNYLLRNEATQPADLLRLALLPPGETIRVGNQGGIAEVEPGENVLESEERYFTSEEVVKDEVPGMIGTAHLFLACLSWSDGGAEFGPHPYPGPIGHCVLSGDLLVGDKLQQCSTATSLPNIFQPDQDFRLQAGRTPPTILLFGAIPETDVHSNPAPDMLFRLAWTPLLW